MQTMKKIFRNSAFILLSISLLSLNSCSKDEEEAPVPITVKSKIINKDYKMTDYTVSVNGVNLITYSDVQACAKDNLTKFLDDLTGILDEGPTKCDAGDPQQSAFTWTLVTNDTQLRIEDAGEVTVYNITINNGTTLKLEYNEVGDFDDDGVNDTGVIAVTYTKQ